MVELDPADAPAPRRPISFAALRASLGRTPVWLVCWGMESLLAIVPALVLQRWMSSTLSHRYAPGSLFESLDTVFRTDQRQELDLVNAVTGELGAALALFAMLIGCFSAGGWLQVFLERTRGESLRRFFFGGARYFWRFFRLLFVTVLTLALLSWLVYGKPWNTIVLGWLLDVPKSDYEKLETLRSEQTVVYLTWARDLAYAIGVALVLAWGTYTRTRLALFDTHSAVWAGICSWFTVLRHPFKALLPLAALFAIELAIVIAAGLLARRVDASILVTESGLALATLMAIGVIALLWRVVLRGAWYHAAVAVSREIVRPIARPDPWKESFGPPAGPRYPLGGDEFGMSL